MRLGFRPRALSHWPLEAREGWSRRMWKLGAGHMVLSAFWLGEGDRLEVGDQV